jgi:gliding motility-associated-like protein/uncharacterized repeat protein (TIGR01451 family)
VDGSGCESAVRLAVTITISSGTTPTTNDTTQSFCQVANPTIANIQVNESNVSWYASANATTPLAPTTLLVNGATYYGSLIDSSGCESTVRLAVTITISSSTMPIITGGTPQVCTLQQVTYTTNAGMTNYLWSVTNGIIVSGGQTSNNTITISWLAVGNGSVTVSYTNTCNVSDTATISLLIAVCSDLTITKTVNNPTPLIDENVIFTITVNNVGSSQISDVVVTENLPSGYSFITATPSVGSYSSVTGIWNIPILNANQSVTLLVTAQVLQTGIYLNTATINTSNPVDIDLDNNEAEVATNPICLIVYNEFSPNNDGSNELFLIDCLEKYPDNKLEVFNRYGALVYSKSKYTNDWDGTSNVSGTVRQDDKLPTGTYYYVLDISSISVVKSGWLSIIR